MRLIHTGDIHIGSALALLPQEKAKLRQTEILDGFRRLSVFARENAVAAVLKKRFFPLSKAQNPFAFSTFRVTTTANLTKRTICLKICIPLANITPLKATICPKISPLRVWTPRIFPRKTSPRSLCAPSATTSCFYTAIFTLPPPR